MDKKNLLLHLDIGAAATFRAQYRMKVPPPCEGHAYSGTQKYFFPLMENRYINISTDVLFFSCCSNNTEESCKKRSPYPHSYMLVSAAN